MLERKNNEIKILVWQHVYKVDTVFSLKLHSSQKPRNHFIVALQTLPQNGSAKQNIM